MPASGRFIGDYKIRCIFSLLALCLENYWKYVGPGFLASRGHVDGVSYTFGPFRLSPSEQLLLRGDLPISLAPKTFELLVALVTRHGQLMTRDELMHAIWPDSFVEEINLTVNISLLRKTLGEQPDGRQYIATVPKRGYRFDAPVAELRENIAGANPPAVAGATKEQQDSSADLIEPASSSPPIRAAKTSARRLITIGAAVLLVIAALWITYRKVSPRRSAANQPGQQSETAQGTDPRARELYTEGRADLGKRSAESVQKSIGLFQQAIAV